MPNLHNAPATGVQDTAATIVGLRVKMPPCRACACITATVAERNVIVCDCCARKRDRLDRETQRFLRDLVAIFGRPTAPIEIRPQTSPQPTGAGVETSSSIAPNKG
jgi:hypothetical protein